MRTLNSVSSYNHPFAPFFLLFLVSFSWAGTFLLIKIAVSEIPPATLVALRLGSGLITLLIWLRCINAKLTRHPEIWSQYMQIAVAGQVIPFFLISWAAARAPVGEVVILIATTPLFAALISHLAERTWPSASSALSLTLGFIGIIGFMSVTGASAPTGNQAAQLALLIAAFSYAVSGRMVARLPGEPPINTVAAVSFCATLVIVPISLVVDKPWTIVASNEALGAALILGSVSTAAIYVAYYRLISMSGPTFASLHHYLVPALSVSLAAFYFGEYLGFQQIVFFGFIISSFAFSTKMIRRN